MKKKSPSASNSPFITSKAAATDDINILPIPSSSKQNKLPSVAIDKESLHDSILTRVRRALTRIRKPRCPTSATPSQSPLEQPWSTSTSQNPNMPPELVLQVIANVKGSRDLAACAAVNRMWSACASEKLWTKVRPPTLRALHKLYRVVAEEHVKLEHIAKKKPTKHGALSAKKWYIKGFTWKRKRPQQIDVNMLAGGLEASISALPTRARESDEINIYSSPILQIQTLDMSHLSIRSFQPKKPVNSSQPFYNALRSRRPLRRTQAQELPMPAAAAIAIVPILPDLAIAPQTTTQWRRLAFSPQLAISSFTHSLRDNLPKLASPPPSSLATTTSRLLSKLPSCKTLILPTCTITRPHLLLKAAQHLTHLDLSRAVFKSHVSLIAAMIANCAALQSLTLSSVMCADQRVHGGHWGDLGMSLPNLKEVRIESRKPFLHLHGSQLPVFFEACNNLERVVIRRLCCLEFRTIVTAIGGSNARLRRLHLDFKFSVGSTPDLMFLADHCPSLRSLHLAPAGSFTDEGVTYLVKKCTHLRQLSLSGAVHITDASIDILATSTCLRRLDLTRCSSLTPAALLHLARLPHLHTLSMAHAFAALTPPDEVLGHLRTLILSCVHLRSLSLTLNSRRVYPARIASGEGSRSCGCRRYGGGAHIVAKGNREVRQLLDLRVLDGSDMSAVVVGLPCEPLSTLGVGFISSICSTVDIVDSIGNENADAIIPIPRNNNPSASDEMDDDVRLFEDDVIEISDDGGRVNKSSSTVVTRSDTLPDPDIDDETANDGLLMNDGASSISSASVVGYARKSRANRVDNGKGMSSMSNDDANEYGDGELSNRISVCSSVMTGDNE
ncbi:hypothetical protein SeMB42_g04934 [Synchytrium endobioticum]|uniref:F-box domain-containing protein n=1 Tax=Synchytrium endobioticum TaxID=286115 RepID=A0A507CV02_9FUNG|nr:hypothetical protein SeMB42_g04934 [Synchytrium endobioticum]